MVTYRFGSKSGYSKQKSEITFENEEWSDFLTEHKMFSNIGCKVYTTVIHSGWIGENEYDYSAVDRTLDAIFSVGDDVLYLPRVKLNAPLEWLKSNPNEIALSSFANKNPESIADIYKTYSTAKEIHVIEKGGANEHGVYMQSFFSDKWVKCASEALRRFIHHLENGKYADRIVGYHFAYGMCGETCNWGAWRDGAQFWGDFSKNAQQKFLKYCEEKYGSFDEVKKVYGMPNLKPDDIVPSPEERHATNKDILEYFRVNNKRAIDFSVFLSDRNAQNICDFAKAGKQVTQKPMGSFYGYLLTWYPTETGHIGIQKLMDCKEVDFLSAPKIYYRYAAGQPGGSQATSMSVARKKIWLDELDNDTHIAKHYQQKSDHPETFFETKTILWREVARNLAWHNQNFWWMDLYGGWFLDDEIMAELAKVAEFNREMRKIPYKSISEILFVTDEKSLAYQTADGSFVGCRNVGIINEMGAELKLCGAPVDEYRLEDLKDLDLSQYKMIVFANAFLLNDDMREIIKKIPKTTLCVWNYAAGVRNGEKFDLSYVKDLLGLEIAEYENDTSYSNGYGAKALCPPLKILESGELEVIERYEDGEIKTAKIKNHLLAVSPGFYADDFHNLAKMAGCHMYTSSGCTVFADKRFLGVFPGKDGANSLSFKEECGYVDVISGKAAGSIDALEPKGAYIFVKE